MNAARKIDKQKVARSFLRGKSTYDSHAKIQHKVSKNLVERLSLYPHIQYRRVLEIGCCTGNLTEMLLQNFSTEALFLNDLVPTFYEQVADRISHFKESEIIPMFGDIEALELPQDLDLVVSSATFQWLNDLPYLFSRIAEALQDGGYLAFSIFGPGTLQEFKEVTGIGLEYSSVGYILDALEERFSIEEQESNSDQLFFSTPREILRHLQATGVGGVQEYRWTPSKIRNFEKTYYENHGSSAGVPVTYISSYVIASKR